MSAAADYDAAAWMAKVKASLPEVLGRLGLAARGDRTTCPSCGAEPKTRKCRVYPRNAPAWWTCEGCAEGGSALDAVAHRLGLTLGDGDAWATVRDWCAGRGFCEPAAGREGARAPRLRPLPKPAKSAPAPSRWRGPPVDLRAAWPALRAHHRPDLAAAYWRARGVDQASAEALAELPDLVHLPPAKPAHLAAEALPLWSLTTAGRHDAARPFLALTRDANGEPRGVQRRTIPGAAKVSGPKSKALPGEVLPDDYEGRPHLLGSARAAARALAAGERVALVEGEIDHACATVAGLVAFGATSATGLPRAGAALAEALAELARAGGLDLARMGLVVTVAHRGDAPTAKHPEGAGGPCMSEAAEALRVVGARVAPVVLPLREDGRADLGDVAEGKCGPRAERPELAALDAVRETLTTAAEPAGDGDAWASTVEDARARVLPEVLREAIRMAQADRRRLVVVETPPGTGKTRAAVALAAASAAAGLRVVYAVRDHALAREAMEAAQEGAPPSANMRHARGLLAPRADGRPECRALREAEDVAPPEADTLRRALHNGGRTVCQGCPYRETCDLAPRPVVRPFDLVFAPVAMVEALRETADLVILDDCAKALDVAELAREAVAGLADLPDPPHKEAPAFLAELEAVARAEWEAFKVRETAALVEREAARSRGEQPPPIPPDAEAGYRLTGEALAEALAPAKPAAEAWARAAPKARESFPAPAVQGEADRGAPHWSGLDRVPDREAIKVASLARAIAAGEPHPLEALAMNMGAEGWSYEVRRPPPVPKAAESSRARPKAAVVALDGTASRTPTQWAAAAAGAGRELHTMRLRIVASPRRVAYTWRKGKGLNSGRLGSRARGVFTFATEAAGAVGAALGELAADLVLLRASLGRDLAVGLVTHKPLAVVMRIGMGLDVPEADRAGVTIDRAALELGRLALELRNAVGEVRIGHYGADDRGTNRFDDVDALCVLGAPRPPLAAIAADAEALGRLTGEPVDPVELRREGIADTLAQCVARGRPLSNDRLAVVAGCVDADAPDGPDLPGLVPETRSASAGDWRAWQRFRELAGLAETAATAGVLPAAHPPAGEVARALGWTWAEDRRPARRGRPAAYYAPPCDAFAAFRFRCLFKDLGIYLPEPEGGSFALPEAPSAPPGETAPSSFVGLAPENRQVAAAIEESENRARAALGRLLHRRGFGPPTAGELAELAGCTVAEARGMVAEVLREAEGYAEATGAAWPPPAWADPPPLVPSTPPANEDAPRHRDQGTLDDARALVVEVARDTLRTLGTTRDLVADYGGSRWGGVAESLDPSRWEGMANALVWPADATPAAAHAHITAHLPRLKAIHAIVGEVSAALRAELRAAGR